MGLTNVLINFNRRENGLVSFLRDNKKASALVRGNRTLLKKNKSLLFGKAFHRALYKWTEGHKYAKEIRSKLAPYIPFKGGCGGKRAFLEVLSNPEQNALPYFPQFSKTEEDILTSDVDALVEKGGHKVCDPK